MRNYELVLVLSTKLAEASTEKLLAKIKKDLEDLGGKVESQVEWGKKGLTFRIKKENEGFFLFWQITLGAEKVAIFEQKLKLEEQLLRHLLVKGETPHQTVRGKKGKGVKKESRARKRKT